MLVLQMVKAGLEHVALALCPWELCGTSALNKTNILTSQGQIWTSVDPRLHGGEQMEACELCTQADTERGNGCSKPFSAAPISVTPHGHPPPAGSAE